MSYSDYPIPPNFPPYMWARRRRWHCRSVCAFFTGPAVSAGGDAGTTQNATSIFAHTPLTSASGRISDFARRWCVAVARLGGWLQCQSPHDSSLWRGPVAAGGACASVTTRRVRRAGALSAAVVLACTHTEIDLMRVRRQC